MLLLCPLLGPCSPKIGCVRPLDRRCDRIGNHHIVQSVGTPRVVYDQIHSLVAGWIYVVEDPGDLHPDRLATATNHFSYARHHPIVSAVGEITVESTLLGMDTKDVHVLTTGTGGMS